MRLTLRTLLAYRNDAGLRSRQKKEIRDRIKNSDNAATLLKHLNVITSDPGVLPLSPGNFSGSANPNMIAQYLDSSMPDDEVERFEKDCLATPSLLAEIAICHAVLARVYRNETVPVPPGVRQRIYSLSPVRGDLESLEEQEESDETREVRVPTLKPEFAAQSPQNGTNGTSRTTMTGGRKKKQDSSESKKLQDSGELAAAAKKSDSVQSPWLLPIVAGVCMLALGLGIGWVIGSGKFKNDPSPIAKNENLKSGKKKTTQPDKSTNKKTDNPKSKTDTGKKGVGESKDEKDSKSKKESKDAGKDKSKTDVKGNQPEKDTSGKKTEPKKSEPKEMGKSKDEKGKDKNGKADAGKKETGKDDGKKKQPALAVPVVLARMPVEGQLAIRKNNKDNRYFAFGSDSGITTQHSVLTVHGTKTNFETTQNTKLTVHGAANFQFQVVNKKPAIRWQYGTAEFETDLNKSMVLELSQKSLVIESTRPGTVWWVNSRRFGTNRDLSDIESRVTLVQIFVAKGQLRVTDGKQSVVLSRAHGYEFTVALNKGKPVFSPAKNGELASRRLPWAPKSDWFVEEGLKMIAEKIDRTKPIEPQLTRFTDDLRFQAVTTATQILGALGYYQPLLQLLDNESHLAVWSKSLEAFRFDLANNDQLIKRIDESLEKTDPTLRSMLVGFNEKQLVEGGDEKLVTELSNQTLARRVLAIENLHFITGRTFLFRPDVEERMRKPKVRSWQRDLKAKKIRYADKIKLPFFVFNTREKPDGADDPTSSKSQRQKSWQAET